MVARSRANWGEAASAARPPALALPQQLSLLYDDRIVLACNIEIRVDHGRGRAVIKRQTWVLAHVSLRESAPGSVLSALKAWHRNMDPDERRAVLRKLTELGFGAVEVMP